jgi:hypothetical protein
MTSGVGMPAPAQKLRDRQIQLAPCRIDLGDDHFHLIADVDLFSGALAAHHAGAIVDIPPFASRFS